MDVGNGVEVKNYKKKSHFCLFQSFNVYTWPSLTFIFQDSVCPFPSIITARCLVERQGVDCVDPCFKRFGFQHKKVKTFF